MDFKSIFEWSKTLPFWVRVILYVSITICITIASMSFTSCGTPKTVATVQNVNPNSTVTVTMSVSNATTSTPSVDTSLPIVDSYGD